jgi:hypothetical protein
MWGQGYPCQLAAITFINLFVYMPTNDFFQGQTYCFTYAHMHVKNY